MEAETNAAHSRRRRLWWLVVVVALIALDLWSKAQWEYPPHAQYSVVVEDWIYIRTIWNEGGVWSMPLNQNLLLIATFLAVPLIAWWLFAPRRAPFWENCGKALVLGGAVGNLYDRAVYGAVRDFIDVCFGDVNGWHWPTFNVADMALVVGIALLLLCSFRQPKEAKA